MVANKVAICWAVLGVYMWAALGFTATIGFFIILQKIPEWERRFRWWMLPEAEKQRQINEYVSLVCRPAIRDNFYNQK